MEPGSLETLMQNLVGNAIQHGPSGGSIRLGVPQQDGLLRLSVDNSGPGVPPGAPALVGALLHPGYRSWCRAGGVYRPGDRGTPR